MIKTSSVHIEPTRCKLELMWPQNQNELDAPGAQGIPEAREIVVSNYV